MTLPDSRRFIRGLLRSALYLYVVLIACPIRHWPLGINVDETWRFALNYAATRGLAAGRDIIFTYGPLGYLLFPQDIGNNLLKGLVFQGGLWLLLAAILADLFFRACLPFRNVLLFSICFGLAAPLFWFNFSGVENLILAGALLAIVLFRMRGGWLRYLTALVLIGALPFFKLSAGMIGAAALGGFVVERALAERWKVLRLVLLTAAVPLAVGLTICLAVMPSVQAVLHYLRGNIELTGGFSAAMSIAGPEIELLMALEAVAVLLALLWLQAATSRRMAWFFLCVLAVPIFISFKHGFVRQDIHVSNFFSFAALAAGLILLSVSLRRAALPYALLFAVLPLMSWQDDVDWSNMQAEIAQWIGVSQAWMAWGVLPDSGLRQRLEVSVRKYPDELRLEPEIIQRVGQAQVASLSFAFTNLAAARLDIALFPVIQRYAAFTPYLDGLNAAWVRDKGPRYLVFDGLTIDDRDGWAESPATWLEVYRWYDTRLLGESDLLLERRAQPRFGRLETMANFRIGFAGELRLPQGHDTVFWKMACPPSLKGRLQKLLFRVPEVSVEVQEPGGVRRTARIIPGLLVNPVLANLPGTLAEFAEIFQAEAQPTYSVDWLRFTGKGTESYAGSCEVELLRPSR